MLGATAETSTGGLSAPAATLIGVGITGFVAVVAMVVNYFLQRLTLRHGTIREMARAMLELKLRQLNELYGPLRFLIEQNRRLAAKLREGKPDPDKWRLLDNVPGVLANPQDKAIADAITEIDGKIEDLMINKAGLVWSPGPPESFDLFLGHYQLLRVAMEGRPFPRVEEFEKYPRQLNTDVQEAYDALKREIDDLLQRHAKEMKA